MHRHALIILILGICCFGILAARADERLWLDTRINGKRARLCFDTGATDFTLFREGARRLGLKFTEPPTNAVLPPGEVPRGLTEPCALSLEGTTVTVQFDVVSVPNYKKMDFDGVVGWWGIRNNIFHIDARAGKVTVLQEVPKAVVGWQSLKVITNGGILMLDIPHGDAVDGIFCIDTGSDRGVDLTPARWRSWKNQHPHQPVTLLAFITLADGLLVREEAWSDDLPIGPLVLTGVPVSEAAPMEVALGGPNYEGTLGLAGLKCSDLVVDGKRGVAYLRSRPTDPSIYPYNRLGAVFVPKDEDSSELFARVAQGSPAQDAGIRDGDILLKIDGVDITKTNYNGYQRFSASAGTRMSFRLKRGQESFTTTATLRNILQPLAGKDN